MNGDNYKPTVISLFAGCGGSSLGYKMAGYKELLAIDFNHYAVETFRINFPDVPVWEKDICKVTSQEMLSFCNIKEGELDVLDGSPPCQGFSLAGKRQVNDDRNLLFLEYVRLIKELRPKAFVMEIVPGMIKGVMKGLFIEIFKVLKSLEYNVKCKLMNACFYEVPQMRERLIFVGIRNDLQLQPSYPLPYNDKAMTIKDAIGNLLNASQDDTFNHVWFNDKDKKTLTYFRARNVKQGCKYAGRQKRYFWNKPVGTLQTPGGCITIPGTVRNIGCHPLKTRTFSIREYARLQSFPDDFIFSNHLCHAYKQIGNSVPPKMMYHIAKHLKEVMFEQ